MTESFTEWGIQHRRYHDGKLVGQHVSEYEEDEAEARKDMRQKPYPNVTRTLVQRTVTHTEWLDVEAGEP